MNDKNIITSSIVGLPRSRTYWFSQLLTTGQYHCFHCYPYYDLAVPEDKILLNSTCAPFSGVGGDPVVIERDLEDSMDSFFRYAKIEIDRDHLRQLYKVTEDALNEVRRGKHLVVKYEDINDRLPEILDYMGVDIPEERIIEYIGLNLQSPDDGSQYIE